jgi:hypothetical protein
MAGKLPGKSSDGKRKNNEQNNQNDGGDRSDGRQGNNGRGGRRRGRGGRGSRNDDNNDNLKILCATIVAKKGHYSTGCHALKKNGKESSMASKADFKNPF